MTDPTISIYGEHDEEDDPAVKGRIIKELLMDLNETGYRDYAISVLEECAISLKLSGLLQGRKTAHRARIDGDWQSVISGIGACQSSNDLWKWKVANQNLISTLPASWMESLEEEFDRKMKEVSHHAEC